MGDKDWRLRELEREPPLTWLVGYLLRFWHRLKGPPPEVLPSDAVPPDAWPVCPECLIPHPPLTKYCPVCDEWVGIYRAMVYPDLIWIWGHGWWRLMRRKSVSRLVWVGMVVSALGWLGAVVSEPLPFYGSELGWLERPLWSIWLALALASAVAGMRVLARTWRLWGTWRAPSYGTAAATACEGTGTGAEGG